MTKVNSETRTDVIDDIQAGQYGFPYHYIPSNSSFPMFSKYWSFAPSYLAAIRISAHSLRHLAVKRKPHKHMDFGCGDGGFVNALRKEHGLGHVEYFGVDFDERAIKWAQVFSDDDCIFLCHDVHALPPEEYDSGTLIEVFEHIPPSEGASFIDGIASSLKVGAFLFVTVPSVEKPVEKKHYRHFDFETLEECFGSKFETIEKFGFERQNLISRVLAKILINRFIFMETKLTSEFLIYQFTKKHSQLSGCGRIGMLLRKR